jgi:hypothetical protein
MSEPIRITAEEANSARVSQVLAEQTSFGFAVPQPDGQRQPLIYKPWFTLALAGLLGALLVWCGVEPFYSDGIRFTGRVSAVEPALGANPQFQPKCLHVAGMLLNIPAKAAIRLEDRRRGSVDDLNVGDSLDVTGRPAGLDPGSGLPLFAAQRIRRLSTPVPDQMVDLEAKILEQKFLAFALFPLVAALAGLFIGAADGLLSRAFGRAVIAAMVGLGTGLLGGLVAMIPAGAVYHLGISLALKVAPDGEILHHAAPLMFLVAGRAMAWSIIGLTAGMGQGLAQRSRRLFVNGIVGGAVGGMLGGLLFDPIFLLFQLFFPWSGGGASRAVGFALVGGSVGLFIGLVELMAREAWVRILTGPIAGKEFVLYRNPTWIGSSPKSEIFLFKDPQVSPQHACFKRAGEHYEIEDAGTPAGTSVDGRPGKRTRLRDGSRITIGKTTMEFRVRDE